MTQRGNPPKANPAAAYDSWQSETLTTTTCTAFIIQLRIIVDKLTAAIAIYAVIFQHR